MITFYDLLRKIDVEFTEESPLLLGNVEFWQDADEKWCYSLPGEKWDVVSVRDDLIKILEGQPGNESN